MFTIPSGLQTVYNEYADSLIESPMVGEPCTLEYPALKTACSNCLPGPLGAGGNVFRTGGPAPFSFGSCPICQGSGFKEQLTTEEVRLRVYLSTNESRQKYNQVIASLNITDYEAQIIGYMKDLPKIRRANAIILINEQLGNVKIRTKIVSDPTPWGFDKKRYFNAYVGKI
jgi:hypothetical protein